MDVRKTEIYKRIVTDKIVHYLNEVLIESAVLAGAELKLRLEQAHQLLRPVDFDDVAINRGSMGFCGWPGCEEKAPAKRCLDLLYMIWKNSMDEDVVDSFHSLECYEKFMTIRRTLDSTVSQLRTVPAELAQEFIEKRMASSNVNVLIKDTDIKELMTKPAAEKKSGNLRKKVSFKDDVKKETASHPVKATDVSNSDAEWKRIPKSIAITMSQTSPGDLFKYDYDAPPKLVDKLQRTSRIEAAENHSEDSSTDKLEFFSSMNDLLNCSFETDDSDEE